MSAPQDRQGTQPGRRRGGEVGLLVLTLLALLAYRVDRLPFGGGTTYSADFSEAAGLDEGDEVRIAGVKVGRVTGVALDGPKVKVTFEVEDAWLGDRTTAAIAIKTVLGDKYLALDPLGSGRQDPDARIPLTRTTSPYDVTQAFQDLSGTVDDMDTGQLAESFRTISDTFKDSPPHVRKAATGLSDLSKSLSKRDAKTSPNSSRAVPTSPRRWRTTRPASRPSSRTAAPCSANSATAAPPSAPCSRAARTSAPNSADSSRTTRSSSAPP
ncbi:hypothetical protein STENM223S_07707 [Streptomyces tendae]